MKRREFLAVAPGAAIVYKLKPQKEEFPISCSSYDWFTFFNREGKVWGENLDYDISEFAKSGLKAIEYSFSDAKTASRLIPILRKYEIQMPSIYVNTVLHRENDTEKSFEQVLEIAKIVKSFGTKIIVTNPNPIQWGEKVAKTDSQLRMQVSSLEMLGKKLRAMDMTLAYHTHDMEMLSGAKEFHHMLQNTSPENVSFCFDVHWVYRGSGNSEIAAFDVLKMYSSRLVELHIRQSKNGIWQEQFTADGDIDYKKFASELKRLEIKPHLVIEQCIEKGTPETTNGIAAHQKDLAEVSAIFKMN